MSIQRIPVAEQAAGLAAPSAEPTDAQIRQAAWVARCVGRGESAPLRHEEVTALAATFVVRHFPLGGVLFRHGEPSAGVWITRHGLIELSVGSGRSRVVVRLLRACDVDGDIPLLLDTPLAYTGRALSDVTCLFLGPDDFERLLATHPGIARRWLSSVAQRLAASHVRVQSLLGGSLTTRAAKLLAYEAVEGRVDVPQRTLAAMLGVQRPSLNKVLKELERDGLIRISYGSIEVPDTARLVAGA